MDLTKAILVVDDEARNRNILEDVLRAHFMDYEHAFFEDKEDALRSIQTREVSYEIIITDMRLRGTQDEEGGIEIIKAAKERDAVTQVIVITSYPGNFGNVHKALEAGASFYMERAMVVSTLPSAIRKAEEQRQAIVLLNDFVQCVSSAIDAKDAYTSGHSFRVKEYSLAIGDRIPEITPERRKVLSMAALLHDIGKIGISNCLLHKPGKFTEYERSMMNEHTAIGKRIFEEVKHLPEVLKGIEDHHTHYWDYDIDKPRQGLSLFGRIIAIADTFDAMTSNRAYRAKMSPELAITEIEECCSGTISPTGKHLGQFDPSIVSAFQAAFTEIKEIHDRLADKEFSFSRLRT